MKKIFPILFLFISSLMFGQTINKDSTLKKYNPYFSIGLSMSNTSKFSLGSYPSAELGLSGKNITGGFILGRGNLKSIGEKTDAIFNYYYELKTSLFVSINKNVSVYGLLGAGSYFNFKHMFIEYGTAFFYSFGKLSYSTEVSNWDGIWYLTPGLTYNF